MKQLLALTAAFLLAGLATPPLSQGQGASDLPTPVVAATTADTGSTAPCSCGDCKCAQGKPGCGCKDSAKADCGCAEDASACGCSRGGPKGPGCEMRQEMMHKTMQRKMQDPAEAEEFFEEDEKK